MGLVYVQPIRFNGVLLLFVHVTYLYSNR